VKFRSKVRTKYEALLFTLASFAIISGCGSGDSESKVNIPPHTIKYQTVETIHLEVKNQNLTKEECISIIEFYRDKASNQVAVYKYSSLSEASAPWCVINLQDPENHNIVFQDNLFLK
jgi:hypothetical protein